MPQPLTADVEDELLPGAGDPWAAGRVMRRAYARPWLPK
jgi:hypothetical protein